MNDPATSNVRYVVLRRVDGWAATRFALRRAGRQALNSLPVMADDKVVWRVDELNMEWRGKLLAFLETERIEHEVW
ncbi:MAG TPA: hypothetical protein VGC20_03235 [bacterium]|jgi:hypothetical protein